MLLMFEILSKIMAKKLIFLLLLILGFFISGTNAVCDVVALNNCWGADYSNETIPADASDPSRCRLYTWMRKCLKPFGETCFGVVDFDAALQEVNIYGIFTCRPTAQDCDVTPVEKCYYSVLQPYYTDDLRDFRPYCSTKLNEYRQCITNADVDCFYDFAYQRFDAFQKDFEFACEPYQECDLFRLNMCTIGISSLFQGDDLLTPTSGYLDDICSHARTFIECSKDILQSCKGYDVPLNRHKTYKDANAFTQYIKVMCDDTNYKTKPELTAFATECTNYMASPFFAEEKNKAKQCARIPLPKGDFDIPYYCRGVSTSLSCMALAVKDMCSHSDIQTYIQFVGKLRRLTYDTYFMTTCEAENQALTTPAPSPPITRPTLSNECDFREIIKCKLPVEDLIPKLMSSILPPSTLIQEACGKAIPFITCMKPLVPKCVQKVFASGFGIIVEFITIQGVVTQLDHLCIEHFNSMSGHAKYCNDKVNASVNANIMQCFQLPPPPTGDPCSVVNMQVYDCMKRELDGVCDIESLPVILDYAAGLLRKSLDTAQGTNCHEKYISSLTTTQAATPVPVDILTTLKPSVQTTASPSTTKIATTISSSTTRGNQQQRNRSITDTNSANIIFSSRRTLSYILSLILLVTIL